MRKDGFLEIDDSKITLLGNELFNNTNEKERNVKVELDDFFVSVMMFFKEKGHNIDIAEAKKIICEFVSEYAYALASSFNSRIDTLSQLFDKENMTIQKSLIIEFLIKCAEKHDKNYQVLLKLLLSAIQISLLSKDEEIQYIDEENWNIKFIFTDTNFVLRLLNLQGALSYSVAQETHKTLVSLGIKFIILDTTINEMCKSINTFYNELTRIIPGFAKASAKAGLRSNGYMSAIMNGVTKMQLFKFTQYDYVSSELKKLGFEIFEVDNDFIDDKQVKKLIDFKMKDYYKEDSAVHDLLLIKTCRDYRTKKHSTIYQEETWVLTNDYKLAYYDDLETGGDLRTCMTEYQIANLLWFNNKNEGNLVLDEIIIALSNSNSMSKEELEEFQSSILRIIDKNKEQPEKIDNLNTLFASESLLYKEITEIEGEDEFEKYIANKTKALQKMQKEKQEAVTKEIIDLKSIISDQKQSKLDLQKELNEEYEELVSEEETINEALKSIENKRFKTRKIRKLSLIYRLLSSFLVIAVLLLCGLIFFSLFKNSLNNWRLISAVTLCSFAFPFVITVLCTCIFGEPFKFDKFYYSIFNKLIRKENIEEVTSFSTLKKMYMNNLHEQKTLFSQKQDLFAKKTTLEAVIDKAKSVLSE